MDNTSVKHLVYSSNKRHPYPVNMNKNLILGENIEEQWNKTKSPYNELIVITQPQHFISFHQVWTFCIREISISI